MKVLFVNKDCLIGGIETFMVSMAEALQEKGHECELFFFEKGPMAEEIPDSLPSHFGSLGDLLELVSSKSFDIVHGNSSDWDHGLSAVRQVGAKLVVTVHSDWLVSAWSSINCDAFTGCSRWLSEAQQVLTDLRVQTIYNGIDTNQFKPSEEFEVADKTDEQISSPIVAWVGRGPDLRAKRIDKLAAVAGMLREAGIRIWVADPHGFEKLNAVAPNSAVSLRESAEFWQGVPREEMPTFFRAVSASGGCILSTSFSEGLGLALVEAQACGCPAIGTDVKGVNEVLRPEHGGRLVPFDASPNELADIVISMIWDKQGMQRRRGLCSRFARECFNARKVAEEYLRVYRETLATPRSLVRRGRVRHFLKPLVSWQSFIENNWSSGQYQFETSQKLASQGKWKLAAAAARAAFITCPTLYFKPSRLTHLKNVILHNKRVPAI